MCCVYNVEIQNVLGQCLYIFCFGTVPVLILFWDSVCTHFVLGQCLYIFCFGTVPVHILSVNCMKNVRFQNAVYYKLGHNIIKILVQHNIAYLLFHEKLQLWNRVHYKLGPNHKATSDRILSYQKTALKTCLTDIKTYIIISPK